MRLQEKPLCLHSFSNRILLSIKASAASLREEEKRNTSVCIGCSLAQATAQALQKKMNRNARMMMDFQIVAGIPFPYMAVK
ncbi:hypothetical protein ACO0LD_20040 [Undibacterium sp. Ji83W]|uniref:hypothetical protein n=1 Tax=Undibacterium sp. Ji83W TaxID=3413043 RepID=UPI003BF3A730